MVLALVLTVLAVVVNDSIFAVVLGASFTSTIALMAWIVKTLAGIAVRVGDHGDRLDRLEGAWFGRQFGGVKLGVLAAALLLLVVGFWGALYLKVQSDAQRRESACEFRQGLWDGQIAYTRFLGAEFNATEQQVNEGIDRLKVRIGPRPEC